MDGCNAIRVASINPPFLYGHQLIQPTTQLNNTFLHILGVLGVRYIVRLWYWLTHSLTDAMDGWMDGPFDIGSSRSFHCRVVSYWVCCGMGNSQFTNASIIYLLTPSIHPSIWRNGAAESSWVATFPISPHDNPIGHHNKQQHTEHWTLLPRARSDGRVRARPPTRRVLPSAVQRGVGWWMDGWMDGWMLYYTHTHTHSLTVWAVIYQFPSSLILLLLFRLLNWLNCVAVVRCFVGQLRKKAGLS